jgi:Type II secretion system (T2SS), protein N
MRALAALAIAVVLAAIVIAAAPASLAGWWLAHASGGALALGNAEGRLIAGSGGLATADGRASVALTWRLEPLALLRGVLALRLGATPADPVRGELRIAGDWIELADADVTMPAAFSMAGMPVLAPFTVGGDVHLTTALLRIGRDGAGNALVRWAPARIADPAARTIDFGNATATLAAQGTSLQATLANDGGDTALGGTLRADAARADVDVTLTPRGPTAAPLLQLLAGFGGSAPGGAAHLAWHGAWRAATP